jgi:hypothetical protein
LYTYGRHTASKYMDISAFYQHCGRAQKSTDAARGNRLIDAVVAPAGGSGQRLITPVSACRAVNEGRMRRPRVGFCSPNRQSAIAATPEPRAARHFLPPFLRSQRNPCQSSSFRGLHESVPRICGADEAFADTVHIWTTYCVEIHVKSTVYRIFPRFIITAAGPKSRPTRCAESG